MLNYFQYKFCYGCFYLLFRICLWANDRIQNEQNNAVK